MSTNYPPSPGQYNGWPPSQYPQQAPQADPFIGYPPQQQYQQPPSQPLQQQWSQPPVMVPIPPTRPRKPSSRVALWITIGIFIGLAIGYPVGHSTADNLTANTTTPQTVVTQSTPDTSQQTSQPTEQPTNVQQTFARIGDTLSNSIWKVTLNSVKTSTSDQLNQLSAGDIYLVVDVTAQNLSSTPQILSSGASFTLKDDTGQAYEEKVTGIGVPPDAMALQPNDKLRGQISYEVSKSLHHFTFQFQDINGGTGTWAFSI